MTVDFRGLGHIYLSVVRACEWFEKIGISIADSRLASIREYVQERLLNTSTPEALELETLTPRIETHYALSDGAAFGLIADQLSSLPSSLLPRRTLRDILRGPLVQTRETLSSTDARNKFVELELAAYLSAVGFKLVAFDDVVFEFEGSRYLVECKRPFRDDRLHANIERGYAQLRERFGRSTDRGIVAIAVDKMLSLDQSIREFPTHIHAAKFTETVATELLGRVERYQSMWIDPRVVGFFGVIRFLSKVNFPPSIGPSYNLSLLIMATPHSGQTSEFAKLSRMMNRIQAGFSTSIYKD